jgi:NADH-quinone oxidoreductase subunit L
MMTAIGAGVATAGFMHLLTHGLFKALLFLGAGSVIHAVGSNDLPNMGGLARRMPQTATVFIIGTLSLAGIPFFGGYLSKEEILGAVWGAHLTGPFALLMLVAFLTAFYMFRVVFLAFFGPGPVVIAHAVAVHARTAATPPRVAHAALHNEAVVEGAHVNETPHAHEPPVTMLLPLWVLASMTMAVGVYTTFGGRVLLDPAGRPVPETAPGWLTPAAVGVALAGILLAWATYQARAINAVGLANAFGPIRAAALRKFWIDDVFEGIYGVVLLGFARVVGWVDRYLVDGVLNLLSDWTVQAGDELRGIQTGKPQDYVYGVGAGVLVLILLMRLVF